MRITNSSESQSVNPKDGAELVLIPAGAFLMGDDDINDNIRRTVTLPAYYIYKTPVTVGQYKRFIASPEAQKHGLKMPPTPDFNKKWLKEDHPIVYVSWHYAVAYCYWAGVQLPTEAQWEKAARGADGRQYPWGNEWDKNQCQCCRKSWDNVVGTSAVGSYPDNEYGLFDMTGNVWEWCADWYQENFSRVVRGGSWYDYSQYYFSCAYRSWLNPARRFSCVGFRCIMSLDSAGERG